MNIINILNSNKGKIFKMSEWMIPTQDTLGKPISKSITIPYNTAGVDFGINIEIELINIISNQVSLGIYRDIIDSLFTSNLYEVFDVRPNIISDNRSYMSNLSNMVSDNRYKNLISTGMIASNLQDSPSYSHSQGSLGLSSGLPYKLGSIFNTTVYVDPYMKFNDGRICLFDDAQINLHNLEFRDISDPSHLPIIGVRFDYSFHVGRSKVIYVVDGEIGQGTYNDYISLQRDDKINKIINGN